MPTLSELALKHGTDKGPQHHNYTAVYEKYLEPLRNTKQCLLELGVGGYHYPDRGGESLRMWVEYAPEWKITGTDLYDKSFKVPGAVIMQIAQDDKLLLLKSIGFPTLIIDDASHINPLTIRSFEILWPLLQPGGLYIIEDTETSYWGVASDGTDYGSNLEGVGGIVEYMQHKVLCVDHNKQAIEYIHFYKGLIIIKKK